MQRNKQIRKGQYYRLMEFDASRAEDTEGRRRVPVAISSDAEIRRWFGIEVLEHKAAAVDLSRAEANGLPMHYAHRLHDHGTFLGRIRDLKLSGGRLRGWAEFSNSEHADRVWQDVRDGFLTDISIGYEIRKWREEKSDDDTPTRFVVTDWMPFEASILSVAADVSVGVGRALHNDGGPFLEAVRGVLIESVPEDGSIGPVELELATTIDQLRSQAEKLGLDFHAAVRAVAGSDDTTTTATEEGKTMPVENNPSGDGDVVAFRTALAKGEAQGMSKGMEAERARIAAVDRLFSMPGVRRSAITDALRETAIAEGWSVERTSVALLELRGEDGDAGAVGQVRGGDEQRGISHQRGPVVEPGADSRDKYREAAELALSVRGGLFNGPDGERTDTYRAKVAAARETGYLGMSLRRLAEECLRVNGVNTRGMGDEELVGYAMGMRLHGHTTSDFTNVLENVAGKAMMVGWEEQPETWQGLARIGNLADFKAATRVGLSNFSSLDAIGESGEIKQGTMSDLKEPIQLSEYAKKFKLSRRTIINDDLGAFMMVPRKMGRAASRTVGDVFWAIVTTNAALNQDGIALFHSSHSNLDASGAPPSVAELNAALAAMLVQTDPSGEGYVGGEPRFLIGPPALRGTILTLLNAQKNPAEGTTTSFDADNIYYQAMQPVIEPRLQANSSTAWYLFKDPNIFDTFELAFLDGVQEPYMREEQEWDTRGVEFVVGIDVGGAALDYRNVWKNPGT